MKREIGLDNISRDSGSIVTVGTFDGIHRGHQTIIHYLNERATARDGRSVVISFDPHPRTVLRGEAVPLLTSVEERADILESLGVDRFVLVPFTKDFARMEAEVYVREFLAGQVGLQEIVIGHDHRFGRNREGDRQLLEELGSDLGFTVDVIPAQEFDNQGVISSSAIRQLLREEGDVDGARELLGRRYSFEGTVQKGDGRGRTIGFPTANLRLQEERKLVPLRGVYAVQVLRQSTGAKFSGMMNIGYRPTFDGKEERIEVHLLDFEDELYGEVLRIEFVQRLRGERSFSSAEALAEQLSRDRSRCRQVIETLS